MFDKAKHWNISFKIGKILMFFNVKNSIGETYMFVYLNNNHFIRTILVLDVLY